MRRGDERLFEPIPDCCLTNPEDGTPSDFAATAQQVSVRRRAGRGPSGTSASPPSGRAMTPHETTPSEICSDRAATFGSSSCGSLSVRDFGVASSEASEVSDDAGVDFPGYSEERLEASPRLRRKIVSRVASGVDSEGIEMYEEEGCRFGWVLDPRSDASTVVSSLRSSATEMTRSMVRGPTAHRRRRRCMHFDEDKDHVTADRPRGLRGTSQRTTSRLSSSSTATDDLHGGGTTLQHGQMGGGGPTSEQQNGICDLHDDAKSRETEVQGLRTPLRLRQAETARRRPPPRTDTSFMTHRDSGRAEVEDDDTPRDRAHNQKRVFVRERSQDSSMTQRDAGILNFFSCDSDDGEMSLMTHSWCPSSSSSSDS
eukprot:CAMPEP_0194348394 /NCGR_PEP_ID=MMETSP0171-20130528/106513_1 /TAXON_ID=218684 /ORGANISM="Corethron pennatum, Strain L29A3" /LENGTH=369 /DNA_ID=CAMNT_0039115733 /DNA_START=191 /DNA_END=1298 /DNA_ORIENTATION=-